MFLFHLDGDVTTPEKQVTPSTKQMEGSGGTEIETISESVNYPGHLQRQMVEQFFVEKFKFFLE